VVCRVAGRIAALPAPGDLLGIMSRLNIDFVLRQRDNPRENQTITTTGGLAAVSFDSRRGRKFLGFAPTPPPRTDWLMPKRAALVKIGATCRARRTFDFGHWRQDNPAVNPADPRFCGKRVALAIALLVAVTLLAFAPLPRNGFINYDDPDYVSRNPQVRAGFTLEGVAWAFTSFSHSNWHPLTWISHMADVSLFGLAPGRHHAVSLAIHAAAAILLLLALHLASGALWPSALAAAIFAVHPLHVESVAWASERKDTLCALFWCASLLAYVAHARRPGRGLLSAAVVCHALALLAKPMAVTLPVVLWVLDFWPLGRRARALEKAPFLLLSGASAAVTCLAQSQGGALRSLEVYSLPVRVGNAGLSLVKYLGLALWPSGLSVFHPHPGPSLSWFAAGAAWAPYSTGSRA